MIAGYHLVWTAYGWWLPNDPRGSSSHVIRSAAIAGLGELHHGRKKIQPATCEIRRFYANADRVLRHALLTFTDAEVVAMAASLEETLHRRRYTCYGCALMPDHVHLLVRRHRELPETIIAALQKATRAAVLKVGRVNRDPEHPVWGGPGWKVYLDTRQDMVRTVNYIHQNPLKSGRPEQQWAFVQKYDGWLPGQVRLARNRKRDG